MSLQRDQLLDLYAQRAAAGLSRDDLEEVRRLEEEVGGVQAEAREYETAAAAIQLAWSLGRVEPLPGSLRGRLEQAGADFEALQGGEPGQLRLLPPMDPPRAQGAGSASPAPKSATPRLWAAAAGLLALVTGGLLYTLDARGAELDTVSEQLSAAEQELEAAREPSTRERYDALVASAAALRWDFGPGNDPTGEAVAGDVVWNRGTREGYMRLSGLAVNDPTVEQYQLWIIEDGRQHPIDGGVFDIAETGEVLVPIQAPLDVRGNEALFAITVEQPGGVVVSSKERIAAAAAKPD